MHPALVAFVRSQVAAEKRLQVKTWALRAVNSAAVSISVTEVRCSDPGCADVETMILLMAEGRRTRRARIGLPLAEVTRTHVNQAIAAVLDSGCGAREGEMH